MDMEMDMDIGVGWGEKEFKSRQIESYQCKTAGELSAGYFLDGIAFPRTVDGSRMDS